MSEILSSCSAEVMTFAFDHRLQFEEMAGYTPAKGAAFKELCLEAALAVQGGQTGYGILCDHRIGARPLSRASGSGLWIGRPTEWPGSRPVAFEPELGSDLEQLRDWPKDHVVKLLVFCHPDDDPGLRAEQEANVKRLFQAAQANGLEFLLEIIPSKVGPVDDETDAILIQQFYDAGIRPNWWKLEPFRTDKAGANVVAAITTNDPEVRGIVVLGLDAPEAELAVGFALAARHPLVKGFAVGRTIFGDTARAWMAGAMDDAAAVADMTEKYQRLCDLWQAARATAQQG